MYIYKEFAIYLHYFVLRVTVSFLAKGSVPWGRRIKFKQSGILRDAAKKTKRGEDAWSLKTIFFN